MNLAFNGFALRRQRYSNCLCGAAHYGWGMQAMVGKLLAPQFLRPLFWLLIVFALVMALLPKPPQLPIDQFGDKFAHMLAFAILAGVANLAWQNRSRWTIALLLSAFGAAIELLQAISVLHRDSDIRDWVADSIAIVAATVVARLLLALRA